MQKLESGLTNLKRNNMTVVEWLEDCLTEQYPNGKFVWNTRADIEALFKQAKEMEKQQKGYSEEEVEELIYNVCGTVARLQGITLNGNHIDTAYKQFKKK
jgi:disulfide oxidoreductase YuzD